MKIWILRFISYSNPQPIEALFKSEATARKWFDFAHSASAAPTTLINLEDDYGVRVSVDPTKCAVVLTNTEASASFSADVQQANREAQAGNIHYLPGIAQKSTVQ